MAKINCWEYKNCGRQPFGQKVEELGVCPAATATELNGTNEGINGGRACWAIAGTMCGGTKQGSFAQKFGNCTQCQFYEDVRREQGSKYEGSKEILNKKRIKGS